MRGREGRPVTPALGGLRFSEQQESITHGPIPSPDTATNQRAANSGIVIDDVRSQHARMFIRTPIFDAVILSVIVAELVAVAVRFAGG